jgi:tellurite resistance protein TerC
MSLISIGTPWLWFGFSLFIVLMLALDLGILYRRRSHEPTVKESLIWTSIWITLALLFNSAVWYFFGKKPALEFLAGYLIEKSLSVDNIFIFLVIFSYFNVPFILQQSVLLWGILGALIMRAFFIWLGAVLIQEFHWIIYPFGILLLWTALRLLMKRVHVDPQQAWLVRLCRKVIPLTKTFEGKAFLVKHYGKIHATPLLLVLLAIESTDLIFAIDSIPAVFAVTNDPFIVYTSNIFAMLGLRALYFALAAVLSRLYYLRFGLSLILAFVGIKMLLSGIIYIPITVSITVIILILTGAIIASYIRQKKVDKNNEL